GGRRIGTTQVEITVFEPYLLTDLRPFVHGERQYGRFREHLQLRAEHLDRACGDFGVLVARGAGRDLAGDPNTELGAQLMRTLGHLPFTENNLGDPGGVTEINEDHPAM